MVMVPVQRVVLAFAMQDGLVLDATRVRAIITLLVFAMCTALLPRLVITVVLA